MARRKSAEIEMDLSSFMAVLIMTIGCMVVLLVSNTIIIVSNPNNTRITSVVQSSLYFSDSKAERSDAKSPFPLGNQAKEPSYVDVHRDRLEIYPGNHIVPVRHLGLEGNAFEQLLDRVSTNVANEYVVLLVRPGSVQVSRQLRKAISQRDIDVGFELFEAGRPVNYDEAAQ